MRQPRRHRRRRPPASLPRFVYLPAAPREIELNPVFVLPGSGGVVAVDMLCRMDPPIAEEKPPP